MKIFIRSSLLMVSAVILVGAPAFESSAAPKCSRILIVKKAPIEQRKSPLAPKPLPIRLVQNIYRWYFKKDTRHISEPSGDFLNDHDYIQEKRVNDKMGTVRSIFSKEFDTRIYYTATAAPDAAGVIPVVDPKSRALYFYFHGSGTNKASGANFAYKMNKMAALGYSVVSIDLPYHSDGARSSKIQNADYFYAMLKNIIDHYRVEGMPVYLAGHSFGPDVAAEFVKRYPFGVNGILMISPGSFNDVLEDWFMNHTAHMTALWGDIVSNEDGSAWAGLMSLQHKWRKPPTAASPDPTLVNPNLEIKILSGQYEEYVPGELDERGLPTKTDRDYDICAPLMALFARAKCIIEPGVGHYIFEHRDQNGHDVILRELLALNHQDMAKEKELKDSAPNMIMSEHDAFALRYARDTFFQQFMNSAMGGFKAVQQIVNEKDDTKARKIINDYNKYVFPQRDRALAQNMKDTEKWNPEFFAANKVDIEALNVFKPRPSDAFLNKYFEMLAHLSARDRAERGAVSPTEVYNIPVKQGPPAHILERQERERLEGRPDKPPKREKQQQPQQPRNNDQDRNPSSLPLAG